MDIVDEIISDWADQRPDIDCSGKVVVCRILRNFSHVIAALQATGNTELSVCDEHDSEMSSFRP